MPANAVHPHMREAKFTSKRLFFFAEYIPLNLIDRTEAPVADQTNRLPARPYGHCVVHAVFSYLRSCLCGVVMDRGFGEGIVSALYHHLPPLLLGSAVVDIF